MTELHVGGFNLRNRYKSLTKAIENARQGDTILLHTSVLIDTIDIDKNITIDGNNNTLIITSNHAGLNYTTRQTVLKNMKIEQSAYSNAIVNETANAHVQLENVEFVYSSKIDPRDIYPSIFTSDTATVQLSNVTAEHLDFQADTITIKNSTIGSIFSCQTIMSANQITVENSMLNNTYLKAENTILNKLDTYGELYFECDSLDITLPNLLFYTGTPKAFKKQFKDESFMKDTLVFINIFNCNNAHIKHPRISYKEPPYKARPFTLTSTNLTLEHARSSLNLQDSIAKDSTITILSGQSNDWLSDNSKLIYTKTTGQGQSSSYQQLQEMIGLDSVKEQIKNFMAVASMQAERASRGFKAESSGNINMIFAGAPGTGKTSVAKIIGQMLYDENILPTNKFKVTTRKDFVSKYVGATAEQTHEVFMSALGGVLFIDEAYSLLPNSENDHSQEAIDQLVMDITEYSGQIMIILAGYTEDMKELIEKGNQGLASRFPTWIEFPSYTCDNLLDILLLRINKENVSLDQTTWDYLEERFIDLFNKTNHNGALDGNGRYIENFLTELLATRDVRLTELKSQGYTLDNDDLLTLTKEDIDTVINKRLI